MVRLIIGSLLETYMWVLFARMVLSWIEAARPGWTPRGPLLVLANGVYGLTDPPLKALEKVLKPVDVGGMRLSTSFLGLLLIVWALRWLNASFTIF